MRLSVTAAAPWVAALAEVVDVSWTAAFADHGLGEPLGGLLVGNQATEIAVVSAEELGAALCAEVSH
jgi:hypothetical protein